MPVRNVNKEKYSAVTTFYKQFVISSKFEKIVDRFSLSVVPLLYLYMFSGEGLLILLELVSNPFVYTQ